MGVFGGSSSSSQSLNSSLTFNPIINIGDDNTADSTTKLKGTSDSTASTKDEFGMSAGVAMGDGANATGGPVGVGDSQPTQAYPATSGSMLPGGMNKIYIIGAAALLVGGGFLIYKKKR